VPDVEHVAQALQRPDENGFSTKTFLGVGQYKGRKTVDIHNDTFGSKATVMADETGTYIRITAVGPYGALIFWQDD
jgi:hypothetical protein